MVGVQQLHPVQVEGGLVGVAAPHVEQREHVRVGGDPRELPHHLAHVAHGAGGQLDVPAGQVPAAADGGVVGLQRCPVHLAPGPPAGDDRLVLGAVRAVEERLDLEDLAGHQLHCLDLALEVGVEQHHSGLAGLQPLQLEAPVGVRHRLVFAARDRDGDLGHRLPVGAIAHGACERRGRAGQVGSVHLRDAEDEAVVDGDGGLDPVDLRGAEQELPGGVDGRCVQLGVQPRDQVDLGGHPVLVDDDPDQHVSGDALLLDVLGVLRQHLADQLGGAGQHGAVVVGLRGRGRFVGGLVSLGHGRRRGEQQQRDQQPVPAHRVHHSGTTARGRGQGRGPATSNAREQCRTGR